MADPYLPRPDADLLIWATNFVTYATSHLEELGITAPQLAPVNAATQSFSSAINSSEAARAAAKAATQGKEADRAVLETAVRTLVRQLQASPQIDDAERALLGITVPETGGGGGASMETTLGRPVGSVDTGQRLRHTISFVDESTPTRRAKPAGVLGCEIWVKVGGVAPLDNSECQFLALDTASPYLAEYAGADGGKMAHYLLRWSTTTGEKGPWSETVSATIAG